MGRVCAWCGSVIHQVMGTSIPVSHALCRGCLGELQAALATKGLAVKAEGQSAHRS